MLTYLEAEGIKMTCSNDDVVELGLAVASGKMKYDDILQWINRFKKVIFIGQAYAAALGQKGIIKVSFLCSKIQKECFICPKNQT